MSFPDAASAMVPNGRRHPRWHVLAPFPASVSLVRLLLLPRMVAMYRVLVGLSARRRVSVTLLLHRTPIAQARMGSQYGAKGARLPQHIRPHHTTAGHAFRSYGHAFTLSPLAFLGRKTHRVVLEIFPNDMRSVTYHELQPS